MTGSEYATVTGDTQSEEKIQTGADIDWLEALVSVYPLEINRIYVNQGEVPCKAARFLMVG